MTDQDRPPIWQPETYGAQPGTDQHAGYGMSGQPYAGATPAPAPLPRKRRRWLVPVLVGGALLAGVGIGSAGQSDPAAKTVTVAGPERIVNRDVPGKTVTVTPASCRTALDLAEEIVTGPMVAALQAASDSVSAAAIGDEAAIMSAVDVLTKANGDLDRLIPKYKTAAESCRASK